MALTSKSTIGGDALKLSASKLITALISFLIVMILSRFLSLREYGTYSQIILINNIASSLLMLGLPFSVNFFLPSTDDLFKKKQFLSVYYSLTTLLSILIGVVLYFTTPMLAKYFENQMLSDLVFFMIIFPWVITIITSIENVLIVYKKTSLLIKFRVANSVTLLISIMFVNYFQLSFEIYLIFFLCIEIVFAILVYIIIQRILGGLSLLFDWMWIKKILSFSVPIGLASLVGVINIEIDKLMIAKLLGTESLAIYANASKELPLTIIATSLIAVTLPEIVRLLNFGKSENALRLWGNTTVLSYAIICFFSSALIVYAEEIITLLYSEKFLPGILIFQIYSLVLLLRCTYFGMILNAKGATKLILYSSSASLIINICLNYILFLFFGIIGPAIATFISMLLVIIFQLLATSKILRISFIKVLPWRQLLFLTLLNFILGIAFYFVKNNIHLETTIGSFMESLLFGLLWIFLYLSLTIKFVARLWLKLKGVDK